MGIQIDITNEIKKLLELIYEQSMMILKKRQEIVNKMNILNFKSIDKQLKCLDIGYEALNEVLKMLKNIILNEKNKKRH